MTVVTTIHELPTLCLFYGDTEKFRFVMFENLLKCLNKVLLAFFMLTKLRTYLRKKVVTFSTS